METDKYHALINEICAKAGIADPASMYSAADLQVDGVNFTLFYGGVVAPDSVVVYCDFGELPAQSREAVLLRLLETNMYLFGTNSPTFTYNAENAHIVLACRVPLARATAEGLLSLLAQYAGVASEWRASRFLKENEIQSGKLENGNARGSNSTSQRLSAQLARTQLSASDDTHNN